MILVDFSSIIHRKIHTAVQCAKPRKVNGKLVTQDFINLAKYYILNELFDYKREFSSKFGEIVICLDNAQGGYWRRDVYRDYKSHRKQGRDESEVNFDEVFDEINQLVHQITENLPWKVIDVPRAEADDIILVLSRVYNQHEKILIVSPDKDMIQAQRGTDNVFQYSPFTKKWIKPENKHDNMETWITEHICLGDAADEVPRIIDGTEFSENFLNYLYENDMEVDSPLEFKNSEVPSDKKIELITKFDIYKTNRKGDSTGVKDIYKDLKFGPSNLHKKIKDHGSLDKWLDSNPLYRKNYERNFKLVMEEGIPTNIWNEIVVRFKEASYNYNLVEFSDYLNKNNLNSILMELSNIFNTGRNLSIDDFGW